MYFSWQLYCETNYFVNMCCQLPKLKIQNVRRVSQPEGHKPYSHGIAECKSFPTQGPIAMVYAASLRVWEN